MNQTEVWINMSVPLTTGYIREIEIEHPDGMQVVNISAAEQVFVRDKKTTHFKMVFVTKFYMVIINNKSFMEYQGLLLL